MSRLLFVNAVNRFGGYNVAIACMATEVLGLTLLWLAPSPAWALVGAGLTGFGLSLVYPALGVEAIQQVPSSSRGAGLGAYAVFFDLALAIAGPVMGTVAAHQGYASIFCVAALLALSGWVLCYCSPAAPIAAERSAGCGVPRAWLKNSAASRCNEW